MAAVLAVITMALLSGAAGNFEHKLHNVRIPPKPLCISALSNTPNAGMVGVMSTAWCGTGLQSKHRTNDAVSLIVRIATRFEGKHDSS